MFEGDIIDQVKTKMLENQQTIAVAESVTAGLLQAALASAEEAAQIFQGGITAYNIGQKCRHLAINPIHAMDCNCVSEQMASDMAISVSRMFTSNWGIGITGYATPVPQSGDEVYAYMSIALDGAEVHHAKIIGGELVGLDAQLHYVHTILRALKQALGTK